MPGQEHFEKIWANMLALGVRRLMALAVIGFVTIILVIGSAYYLSRPQMTVLYTGLSEEDISRIGSALQEAGISFDVDTERTAVLVNHGAAIRARTVLAERGLPRSGSAGYELFDQLGSLGLTSFMQEVTRLRALEGELARTIQSMQGITAARVHVVLSDRASFRRAENQPSASVVVRADALDLTRTAIAIRYLVSAAVPGLVADRVTVLSVDGTLLASGQDQIAASIGDMSNAELVVTERVKQNIRQSLAPYLGLNHFQVSVAATINTDQEFIAETVFDPDSRTERSVRVNREEESLLNSSSDTPTSVTGNLPEADGAQFDSSARESEENERREEVINYEISTRTTERTTAGYTIERLSISVMLDRARVLEALPDPEDVAAFEARLAEINNIVESAGGVDLDRGDVVNISAVEFLGIQDLDAPVAGRTLGELLVRQVGDVVSSIVIFILAMLLIWFGLRPAINALVPVFQRPDEETFEDALEGGPDGTAVAAGGAITPPDIDELAAVEHRGLLEDLTEKLSLSPAKKLEKVMALNEEQAVAILKQWYHKTHTGGFG